MTDAHAGARENIDFDNPAQHLAEQTQKFIEATSVDILSAATRAYVDRVLVAGFLGIAISTVASVKGGPSIGPLELEVGFAWAIPAFILLVLIYYVGCLVILFLTDRRRYTAIFRISGLSSEGALVAIGRQAKVLRQEAENSLQLAPDDPRRDEINKRVTKISDQALDRMLQRMKEVSRSENYRDVQVIMFGTIPIVLSITAAVLLLRSIYLLAS